MQSCSWNCCLLPLQPAAVETVIHGFVTAAINIKGSGFASPSPPFATLYWVYSLSISKCSKLKILAQIFKSVRTFALQQTVREIDRCSLAPACISLLPVLLGFLYSYSSVLVSSIEAWQFFVEPGMLFMLKYIVGKCKMIFPLHVLCCLRLFSISCFRNLTPLLSGKWKLVWYHQ